MREVGRQIVGNTICEIILFLVAAQVLEWQDNDREARRGRELVTRGS
jgi:hypothetical protein